MHYDVTLSLGGLSQVDGRAEGDYYPGHSLQSFKLIDRLSLPFFKRKGSRAV